MASYACCRCTCHVISIIHGRNHQSVGIVSFHPLQVSPPAHMPEHVRNGLGGQIERCLSSARRYDMQMHSYKWDAVVKTYSRSYPKLWAMQRWLSNCNRCKPASCAGSSRGCVCCGAPGHRANLLSACLGSMACGHPCGGSPLGPPCLTLSNMPLCSDACLPLLPRKAGFLQCTNRPVW